MVAKQGFLMYNSKGDAIGTKVSVRYRRSGRLSEVVVKRGSTVYSRSKIDLFACWLVTRCSRAEMYPLRFSLSGQRSYAYVMRAEEGVEECDN